MAGAVIYRGLMLAATVFVARLLGKTGYGELGMIQSTFGMFGVFATFGLGVTATKHVAELRQSDPERAGRVLGLSGAVAFVSGGAMAAALATSAPWLAERTINAPHLTGELRVGAIILFFSALNAAQTGGLAGFEAFRRIAQVNLLVGLVSFPVFIAGALWGGLTGAVWALVASHVISWLLNHLALRREAVGFRVLLTFRGILRERSILWRFSLPAVLGGALVGPVNWACGALLVNQPGGYGEMGLFSAANQWRIAILFIPGVLAQVVLPFLSNLNGERAVPEYKKVLRINLLLNAGIALIVVLPLFIFAPVIMLAYGAGYESGVSVLRVLGLSAVLTAVNGVVGSAITSRGQMWTGFTFNAMWAVVQVAGTALLLHRGHGALGVAVATLIAYILHSAWQGAYLTRSLRRADELR